jgi:hypothetical protein
MGAVVVWKQLVARLNSTATNLANLDADVPVEVCVFTFHLSVGSQFLSQVRTLPFFQVLQNKIF